MLKPYSKKRNTCHMKCFFWCFFVNEMFILGVDIFWILSFFIELQFYNFFIRVHFSHFFFVYALEIKFATKISKKKQKNLRLSLASRNFHFSRLSLWLLDSFTLGRVVKTSFAWLFTCLCSSVNMKIGELFLSLDVAFGRLAF